LKSLSEESKKNYSCSNTSKNAAQYIAIKNKFLVFSGAVSQPPRTPVRPNFGAESDAKVKPFFETAKSFCKIFQKFFRTVFASLPTESVVSEADAKVGQISETPKKSGTFSKLFQNLFHSLRKRFSFEAGAKISVSEHYFQIFPALFCDIF